MTTYEKLQQIKQQRGCGYLLLIDPDKIDAKHFPEMIQAASRSGVDAFLVGGSLVVSDEFNQVLKLIKENSDKPVVIFPGNILQISPVADALLFLMLISGRNPESLIGSHVVSAPIIKRMGLETISTGYMLIDGGCVTSAEFMSNTKPIPRNKTDIAVAHALAGEMLGLKMLYLEAGSGAHNAVPDEMIKKIAAYCALPLIVGGGIRTPEEAHAKSSAGASFIVTGTIIEENTHASLIKQFADAIHSR